MYGDTELLRRRSGQLREQAVDLRGLAAQLVARLESTGWSGRAADSMRVRVTERAAHLTGAAAQHDTAADTLDRHVREVESLQDAIADVERRATDLVAEAVTRTAEVARRNEGTGGTGAGVHVEPDPDDVALCAFEPPPSGHRAWLDVELPGL